MERPVLKPENVVLAIALTVFVVIVFVAVVLVRPAVNILLMELVSVVM